jgi:hypothetical protein
MKKILLTIACLWALVAASQKPTTNMVYLTTPNNVTFQYHTTTTDTWMNRGSYSSIRIPQSVWHLSNISNTGWADGKVLKFNSSGDLVPGTTTGGTGIALTDLSATSPIVYSNTTGAFSMAANAYAPYGTVSFPGFGTTGGTALEGRTFGTAANNNYGDFAPAAHVGATGTAHGNASGSVAGFMSSSDYTKLSGLTQYTDALARGSISLTTTGSSGAATYSSSTGVLNIPQYSGGGMVYPAAGIPVSNGSAWSGTFGVDYSVTSGEIYKLPTSGAVYSFVNTNYHPKLVSGTNIATINSISLLQDANFSLQPTLNGTGFVKASGTTITYDNSTYLTAVPNSSVTSAKLNVYGTATQGYALTYDGTYDLTWTQLISGSGSSGRVTYWDGTKSITSNSGFTYDSTNGLTLTTPAKATEFTFGTTGWTIAESSGKLVFKYNGTAVFSMDQSGNFKAAAEIYRGGL